MSKRGPQSSLNHLNWNETDEPEEKGEFAKASEDVLKQRIIKKARRRAPTDDADSTAAPATSSVFGAFKGFSSTPLAKPADKPGGGAQSFSFLSSLGAKTNGNGTATVSSSGADGAGAAKPTFSFGSNAGASSDASKKMFAFGSPTALKADSTEGGKSASSTTSSGFGISSSKEGESGKSAPFGFGAAPSAVAAAPKFSFGSIPPKTTDAPKPNSNFTFGTLAGGNKEADASPKPTFSFGSFAAKPDASGETEKITFGSPSASKEAAATASSTGMFSFGSNATKTDASEKKTFTFGSPLALKGSIITPSGVIKTPVPLVPEAPEPEKPKTFSFGSPAAAKDPAASPITSKGTFSFGAGKPSEPSEPSAKKTFTFGSPAASGKPDQSPKPTFSFGSNAAAKPDEGAAGAEKKTTFSFGTIPSSGAKEGATATPTFSFGSKATPEGETKKTFSFGVPASSSETVEKSKPVAATFVTPKGSSDDAIKQMFSFASSTAAPAKREEEKKSPAAASKPADVTEKEKLEIFRKSVANLNNAFIAWITQSCKENPYCSLQPVLKDYEKHFSKLKEMEPKASKTEQPATSTGASLFAKPDSASTLGSKPEPVKPKQPEMETPKPGFFFGTPAAVTTTKESPTKPAAAGFTFGAVTKPFSFGSFGSTTTTTTIPSSTVSTTSSSFFAGASTFAAKSSTTGGFTFGGVTKPSPAPDSSAGAGDGKEDADEDEPPKVEFTPVEEKDSVYSKRCKLFVKAGGSYSDRGVGTLHVKMVDGKVQLLVRADTSLGNILLNIILNESVPLQRLGKNNVMMICLPTPDAKPPPTSVLLRVKTGEEADELHETLLKYKPK